MPVMLVAASGGHLAQLNRLAPRIPGFGDDSVWITFDTPQSRSLLAHRPHHFVRYTGPRAFGMAALNSLVAHRFLRTVRPELVVSTGNAIAASYLPLAAAYGIPAAYIESAARAEGPSLTGRVLQRVPAISLYTQYESWSDSRWRYVGSIFDQFQAVSAPSWPSAPCRVVVTLGTIKYGFRRLVERVISILPPGCETLWQVGETNTAGLDIAARKSMPASELKREIEASDVVIAHAGIGSALTALESGKIPILVPRERDHGEHIDDHQRQIAATLAARGLAVHRSVDALSADDLLSGSRQKATLTTSLPTLDIATSRSRVS